MSLPAFIEQKLLHVIKEFFESNEEIFNFLMRLNCEHEEIRIKVFKLIAGVLIKAVDGAIKSQVN